MTGYGVVIPFQKCCRRPTRTFFYVSYEFDAQNKQLTQFLNPMMRPFFSFYGGKWRATPRYPAPIYETIIEPFAGSAGYSVRHSSHNVILIEKDPIIASVWRYLISAKPSEVRALPLIKPGQTTDDLKVCQEAKYLIGFWLAQVRMSPSKTPSVWMREGTRPYMFWGESIRERIASQMEFISHWILIEGDYSEAPDIEATWFIDPPYQIAGIHYRYSSKKIDYKLLGDWCKSRTGQTIVCENEGATWLPFSFFMEAHCLKAKNGKGKSQEAIWTNESVSLAK